SARSSLTIIRWLPAMRGRSPTTALRISGRPCRRSTRSFATIRTTPIFASSRGRCCSRMVGSPRLSRRMTRRQAEARQCPAARRGGAGAARNEQSGAGGEGAQQSRRRGALRGSQPRCLAFPRHRLRSEQQHGHDGAFAGRARDGLRRLYPGAPAGGAGPEASTAGTGAPARTRPAGRGQARKRPLMHRPAPAASMLRGDCVTRPAGASSRSHPVPGRARLMRFSVLRLVFAFLLILPLAAPARADEPLTPAQKAEVEKVIRDYFMAHPEFMIDVLHAAEAKLKAQKADESRQAIAAKRQELLHDTSSPVGGDPQGDVTIVEFF